MKRILIDPCKEGDEHRLKGTGALRLTEERVEGGDIDEKLKEINTSICDMCEDDDEKEKAAFANTTRLEDDIDKSKRPIVVCGLLLDFCVADTAK